MKRAILYIFAILAISCEINQKEIKPTDEFIKVYNHPDEDLLYYATSVIQVPDGFLILSGVKRYGLFDQYPTATLIKTGNLGEVIWTQDTDWLAPSHKLLQHNGTYGFVGMRSSFENPGSFVSINIASGELTGSTVLADVSNPSAAHLTADNRLVVLGYNSGSQVTTVTMFNNITDLSKLGVESMAIGSEAEKIGYDEYLNKTGYQYPFFIGDWSQGGVNGFFINCLYNFTLGTVFFNADGQRTNGWIFVGGEQDAPSSLLHKSEGEFAITRYFGTSNFLSPTVNVNVNSPQNFNDSTQNPLYELPVKAKVRANKISFGANEFMLFTSTTNYNSIVLSQYKMDDDEVYHSKYIDFDDEVEVIDVIQDTDDEGIIVLARIQITGRFLRTMLLKIPKRHFKES